MKIDIIHLNTVMNDDLQYGGLSFFEGEKDVPFEIKRIYWIYKVEHGLQRGFHAHKMNWQLLFCPYGAIDIIVDDGDERKTVTLDNPSVGLVLHPGLWREMIWLQDNSVLCVAASEYYDPQDYIRNYDEFLKYVAKKKKGDAK